MFGFQITYFGILTGIAILLGMVVLLLEASYYRQNLNEYVNLSILVTIFALLGARGSYVLFQWNYYKEHVREIFELRRGGLWIYGAIFAGIFIVLLYSMIRKLSVGTVLDTYSTGLMVASTIASPGSFFSREGFGEYTESLLAMQIPVDAVSVNMITEKMKQHIEMSGGERFIQVTPLFIGELIWSIVVIIIMILYRYRKRFQGELFLVYLAVYSTGNVVLEWIRVDGLRFLDTKIKVTSIAAGITAILSVLFIVYNWGQSDRARIRRVKERRARKFSKMSKNKNYLG